MLSTCIVCNKTGGKGACMHQIPPNKDMSQRQQWLTTLGLKEDELQNHYQVCSCHFRNGDVTEVPSLTLNQTSESPKKMV